MPLISREEEQSMQMYSRYSYIFEAMAEGLREVLDDSNATSRIPAGVLDSAKEFLIEAANATGNKPPRDPVESAGILAMVCQNVPAEYLGKGFPRLARDIRGLALLIEELGETKKIPDLKRNSYLEIYRLFQGMSNHASTAENDLYMMGTESDADDGE